MISTTIKQPYDKSAIASAGVLLVVVVKEKRGRSMHVPLAAVSGDFLFLSHTKINIYAKS